jgi:hypothetical protein
MRRAGIAKLIVCRDEFGSAGPSWLAMDKLSCDVRALRADVAALDALARLKLAAREAGFELRLVHASAELTCLIDFTGLAEVLRVEPGRQAEEREQGLGVEEEAELHDPAA